MSYSSVCLRQTMRALPTAIMPRPPFIFALRYTSTPSAHSFRNFHSTPSRLTSLPTASTTPTTPTPTATPHTTTPPSPPFESPAAVRAAARAAREAEEGKVMKAACGEPVVAGEEEGPEMVSVVNEATGEIGGPRGKEPTRYGDWEAKGRCWDF